MDKNRRPVIAEHHLPSVAAEYRDVSERMRLLLEEVQAGRTELYRRLASARQQLSVSRAQLASARLQLASSRVLLAQIASASGSASQHPTAPAGAPGTNRGAAPRIFPAVAEMIRQIEEAASSEASGATHLIEAIAIALQGEADPSLMMGVLLEGLAQTVLERLPAAEQRNTAIALAGLLWERVSQGLNEV